VSEKQAVWWSSLRVDPDKALSRTAGLKPGTGKIAPRRRVGTATGLALPPPEFTPAVKRAVRKRAGGGWADEALCEGCWTLLGAIAGDFQHRVARGSGGCRDEVVQSAANCLLLCRPCHREAEGRRRDLSQDGAGFWIEHGTGLDYDPRFVAVLLGALGDHGITRWLAADGKGLDGTGYLEHPPLGVAA